MELKIIGEKNNELFSRKEIKAIVKSVLAPKREDVLKEISDKFSVSPEVIKIKGIYGKFGVQEFDVMANIYNSKQDKDAVEIKKKKEVELEKKSAEAEKTSQEKPEESKSDQPKQEQAEEKSEEQKKESKPDEKAQPDKEPSTKEIQKENKEEAKE